MKNPNFVPKPNNPAKLSEVSVYAGNQWNFYTLNDLNFVKKGVYEYAQLKYKTGLIKEGEQDASKVVYIGNPGDYIFRDSSGSLTIIKNQDFPKYV